MIRLLHFTEAGDTSGYFRNLAERHDRSRYRVLFGTLQAMPRALEERMRALDVACFSAEAASRASYPGALVRLARFLRQEGVQILHTHLFDPSIVGLAAAHLAGTQVRVLTRHYSDYHTRIRRRWHVRLDQLCTRLADRVIAVSQHTADHMVAVEGAPREKIVAVHNGVDFDRLLPCSAAERLQLRREFGAESAHLVVVPARLHPEKGHSILFRALPGLGTNLARPVVVVLAGTGPFEASYRAELAALGCEDRVRFAGFRQDLGAIIQAADLVVLPSVAEAFGFVLVEALFLETPVVASRVGGIPEIVEDGVNGMLVPAGDSDALRAALFEALSDDSLRSRLATGGRARMVERFGVAAMVRSYEEVYEDVLGARR